MASAEQSAAASISATNVVLRIERPARADWVACRQDATDDDHTDTATTRRRGDSDAMFAQLIISDCSSFCRIKYNFIMILCPPSNQGCKYDHIELKQ